MYYWKDPIDQGLETAPTDGCLRALLAKTGRCRLVCFALLVTALVLLTTSLDAQRSSAFRKALRAARSGQLETAIKLWTVVIQRNPKSYSAYVNRGSAYLLLGRVLEGLRDWHQAKECAPLFAYGVYSPGFILEGNVNPALLNYARSLELDPDHVPSVMMLGALYQDLGRDEVAIELYRLSADLTRNPILKNHFNHWIKSLGGEPEE